jgi:hypothetical protein
MKKQNFIKEKKNKRGKKERAFNRYYDIQHTCKVFKLSYLSFKENIIFSRYL